MGYVGLPLAVAFSKKFKVIGFDINKNRINELNIGKDTTLEVKNLKKKKNNLFFTFQKSQLENCNVFIVTVPTPVNIKNLPDLSNLHEACKLLGKIIKKGSVIIFESTVFPGCTEEYCMPVIEKFSKLKFNKDFF